MIAAPGEIGTLMEDAAARYLAGRGYAIVERNYRTRFGEIDVVAVHEGVLAFVEVRYRKSSALVGPALSLTRRKQERMRKAVRRYLCEKKIDSCVPVRVDLCAVGDMGRSFEVLRGVVDFS